MTRIGNTSRQRGICGRRTPPTGEREAGNAGTCEPDTVLIPKRFALSGYQCLERPFSIHDSRVNCDQCTTALSTKVSDLRGLLVLRKGTRVGNRSAPTVSHGT